MLQLKSESPTFPVEIDLESSRTTVFVRTNIQAQQRQDMDGSTRTVYTYDESQYTREEYAELQTAKTRADVDYLAIMTGVEL